MNKTTKSIAGLVALILLASIGGVICVIKSLENSESRIARLGRENATMTERWIVSATQRKLDAAFPGLRRDISASGGEYVSNPKNQFEVLTAKDIYWWEDVDPALLAQVAAEVESLPELEAWALAGIDVSQQRKVEIRLVGGAEKLSLRILFLCSNLPEGQTTSSGFLKNMWP